MEHGTTKFEAELKKISHYKQHPQMMPFVGNDWGKFKKFLILAESHYLPSGSDKAEQWYKLSKQDLTKDEIGYTATHTIFDEVVTELIKGGSLNPAHRLYKDMANAMAEFKPDSLKHIFLACGFMNYFQRPAETTGKGIHSNEKDNDIAYANLCAVAKIIKPDFIFFCTSNGWKVFNDIQQQQKTCPQNIVVGHSCHPRFPHWNMPHYPDYANEGKKATGKNSFISFVQHHKIFS